MTNKKGYNRKKDASTFTVYGFDAGIGDLVFSTANEFNPHANLVVEIKVSEIKTRKSVPIKPYKPRMEFRPPNSPEHFSCRSVIKPLTQRKKRKVRKARK